MVLLITLTYNTGSTVYHSASEVREPLRVDANFITRYQVYMIIIYFNNLFVWAVEIYLQRDQNKVWTGVTGISLCTADVLAAGKGQRSIAVLPHTNSRTYQLYWRRCCNCLPSLSIHFWHLFIKFPITRCSYPVLMLLLSSRILRSSSSRVRGFVLYTAFFNLPRDRSRRGSCRDKAMEFLHPGIVFQRVFVLGWQTELTNIDHK